MSLRYFILRPTKSEDWLSLEETATRLQHAFAQCRIDREKGAAYSEKRIAFVRQLYTVEKFGDRAAELLREKSEQYQGAFVIDLEDVGEPTVRTFVALHSNLNLEFEPGVKFSVKQRIAKKVASSLGYFAAYSEEW